MSLLRERLGLPGKKLIGERLRALTVAPHPKPLFVFGNQKSGTTAVAGLLAAGAGLPVTLDFAGAAEPFIGRLLRGETPLTEFVRRNAWAFSAGVVKEPSLTFLAPRLMEHFGVRRAVFVIRDPYDNIRSILDRLELRGDLAALDPESLRTNRTWRSILAGRDLGLPNDHYIATLARRWLRAAEILKAGGEHFETVRYDAFNADRIGTIRAVARGCELESDGDITTLASRDFQRRGRPRPAAEFFGDNLSRINEICGTAAQSLGFAATH